MDKRILKLEIKFCLLAGFLLTACGGSEDAPDPTVQNVPIAYVKRPLPTDNQDNLVQDDVRRALTFNEGGDLFLRDRASPVAAERNLTSSVTNELGDVKDIEVSYDGTKLIFSLREEDPNPNDNITPSWNIWEYDITNNVLRRVISSDITAELGDDLGPHYLPDGRIVFSSTRHTRSKAILIDEGKTQFAGLDEDRREHALLLHVMNDDGTDIHQISFNQSHDLEATVLQNGRILYRRWDNAANRNDMGLYSMNPDGTEVKAVYGIHSHNTGTNNSNVQFTQPHELSDGNVVSLIRSFTGTWGGGDIVTIDISNYADNTQPTWINQGSLTGPAQTSITPFDIDTQNGPSLNGRYQNVYPMWDNPSRFLVTWNQCRLIEDPTVTPVVIIPCTAALLADPNVQEADPLYGAYVLDTTNNTQLPVVVPQEGFTITDVAVATPRDLPTVINDKVGGVDPEIDVTLEAENVGVLHIRSVYDFDGTFDNLGTSASNINSVADFANPASATADERPARFLRITKAVSIPDRTVKQVNGTAFGRSTQQGMREIVGYAPIEPDGSVKIKVPAEVPLAISVLDKEGRRISNRHLNWIKVKAGETLECIGCHTHANGMPHGRPDNAPTVNTGAATSGIPFPNTEPAMIANMGETMAETRSRISCQTNCAALEPSIDLIYTDDWTDPTVRAKDAAYSYLYTNLTTTNPANNFCSPSWEYRCRVTINYVDHIHPLWEVNRGANTCTNCHTTVGPQVADGQLDLSGGASPDQADHLVSYRELLFQDNEQILSGGSLIDRLVPGTDANGNPIMVPVPVNPSMQTSGARTSFFMEKMLETELNAGPTLPTPTVNHAGFLSNDELKLISEWLDMGAQYYNNPFDAP